MKKIFYVITGHLFFNTIFALGVYDLFKLSEKSHPSFYKINLSKDYAVQKTKELKGLALPTVSFDATADYGNKSLLGKSGLSRIDHTESIGLEATLYQGGAEYNYFDYKKLLPKIAKSEIHLHRLNYYMQINHHYYRFLSYRNENL